MAITKNIVDMLGGTIQVESEVGGERSLRLCLNVKYQGRL